MANRFTASMLLLLAGVCVLPTRPTAAGGQEKKQGAGARCQEDPKKFYTREFQQSAREQLAGIRCPIVLLNGDLTRTTSTKRF